MPIYRGIDGAGIVAKKAYGAYGRETTPEIVRAFYDTLKGRSLKKALAAVERCYLHPNRTQPPTCSEVLGEMLIEEHEAAKARNIERQKNKYREGVLATPEVLEQQMREAREKYPHLFDRGDSMLGKIAEVVKANQGRPPSEFEWNDSWDF